MNHADSVAYFPTQEEDYAKAIHFRRTCSSFLSEISTIKDWITQCYLFDILVSVSFWPLLIIELEARSISAHLIIS